LDAFLYIIIGMDGPTTETEAPVLKTDNFGVQFERITSERMGEGILELKVTHPEELNVKKIETATFTSRFRNKDAGPGHEAWRRVTTWGVSPGSDHLSIVTTEGEMGTGGSNAYQAKDATLATIVAELDYAEKGAKDDSVRDVIKIEMIAIQGEQTRRAEIAKSLKVSQISKITK